MCRWTHHPSSLTIQAGDSEIWSPKYQGFHSWWGEQNGGRGILMESRPSILWIWNLWGRCFSWFCHSQWDRVLSQWPRPIIWNSLLREARLAPFYSNCPSAGSWLTFYYADLWKLGWVMVNGPLSRVVTDYFIDMFLIDILNLFLNIFGVFLILWLLIKCCCIGLFETKMECKLNEQTDKWISVKWRKAASYNTVSYTHLTLPTKA